ncbi:BolA family protein [Yoonia sp. MH D7]
MGLDIEIKAALQANFAINALEVINESAKHAGHAGDDGTGESHWRIVIAAPEFAAMTRIARHRAIHSALGTGIIGRIHALAIEAR